MQLVGNEDSWASGLSSETVGFQGRVYVQGLGSLTDQRRKEKKKLHWGPEKLLWVVGWIGLVGFTIEELGLKYW